MTPHELALARAIVHAMLSDLSDQGVLSSSEQESLQALLAGDSLKELLFEQFPRVGRALDAYLHVDANTDEQSRKALSEAFEASAVGILPLSLVSKVLMTPEDPNPQLIKAIRQIAYLYYKYETPIEVDKAAVALGNFSQIEAGLADTCDRDDGIASVLEKLFRGLDLATIQPRHGPGAVSGKETGARKYDWAVMPKALVDVYSYDYFVASFGHLCEVLHALRELPDGELKARVILVPKDSRGPRVISAEPKENQWIQQGQMRAIVRHVESSRFVRRRVLFTDQTVNAELAQLASVTGHYATLDLSEASDRVSNAFVRAHFPEGVVRYLEASRTPITVLPDGTEIRLKKFAPMGSACCFPVLATSVFACLVSRGITDCHVYGDDVIVPTAQAALSITALESIGLKANPLKCFSTGFFRESCGTDAFRGVNVTPLRIKTRWSHRRSPDTYVSYVAYANSLHRLGYLSAAQRVAEAVSLLYGAMLQNMEMEHNVPTFTFPVSGLAKPPRRVNPALQQLEYKVLMPVARPTRFSRRDTFQVLHWLSLAGKDREEPTSVCSSTAARLVSLYTKRGDVTLKRKWTSVYPIRHSQ